MSNQPSSFRRRLLRDERGAIAPMLVGTILLIVAAWLGAVDLVRFSMAQGRLQNALDAAVLSAGRNLADLSSTVNEPEFGMWQQDAYAFFHANMPQGYLGSTVEPEDLHIRYFDEMNHGYIIGQRVEMDAAGVLPLLSTAFLKVASLPLEASNEAVRRTRSDLEVVMALDNTGSMDAEGRMTTLKAAARDLTETVLGASQASGVEGRVFIGLVPFAEVVNVGNNTYTRQWMQNWVNVNSAQRQRYINNLWNGCVSEPKWASSVNGKLPAQVWQPTSGFQPITIVSRSVLTRSNLGLSSRQLPLAGTSAQPQPVSFGPVSGRTYRIKNISGPLNTSSTTASTSIFNVDSWGNTAHCVASREVLFLNDNEAAIEAKINAMYSDGGTIIPAGLLWAWRMLHPAWRGTPGWGDPDKPRDPEPKILAKAIVLLTDGDNEATTPGVFAPITPATTDSRLDFTLTYGIRTSTTTGSGRNQTTVWTNSNKTNNFQNMTANRDGRHPMNSLRVRDPEDFSSANDVTIGYRQTAINKTAMDGYLADLCQAVKNDGNGIKIYTVTLGRSVTAPTKTLMANCSSGPNYAYVADNVNDLPQVFKSIAGALTELRLTK